VGAAEFEYDGELFLETMTRLAKTHAGKRQPAAPLDAAIAHNLKQLEIALPDS